MKRYATFILILCMAAVIGCRSGAPSIEQFSKTVYTPSYAKGFDILGADGLESTVIVTKSPWQNADSPRSLFIRRNGEKIPNGFRGEVLDTEAGRIICMSTSYTAMLSFLSEEDRIAGVSGKAFLYDSSIAGADIADVGFDGQTDYEALLTAKPDLVLLYGIGGASSMEQKLRELGIPFIYMGEYLEEDPLGKAEWLVVIAEITGKRDKGAEVFQSIPARYNSLKEKALAAENRPKIMVNAPYGDTWIMSPPGSYIGQLIRDAGGDYMYSTESGNKSLAIDMEQAYKMASGCDIWINAGNAVTMEEFMNMLPKFTDIPAVRNRNIYTNNKRTGNGGGNDFWESGIVFPDLILADLINIFHPGLLDNGELNYYLRLE